MCPFADAHVREVLHRQRRHFAALRGECFFIQRTFRHSRHAIELHQAANGQVIRRARRRLQRLCRLHVRRGKRRIHRHVAVRTADAPECQLHVHMSAAKRRKRLANRFLQEGQTAAEPHGQVQKAMVHCPKLHGHLPVALARCLLAISGHALHPAIPPLQKIYYTTSRRTLQVVSRICATSAFSHCNLDTQSARCYTLEHPRMFFLCFSPICHAQGGCSP